MQLAVLAGDFLLSRAFGALASLKNTEVNKYLVHLNMLPSFINDAAK